MNNPVKNAYKHIVITGASSGLGAALAVRYAAPGVVLSLTGRHAKRLEQVAAACRKQGAAVVTSVLDVTDAPAMQHWLHKQDTKHPVNLVIANAGISGGTAGGAESDQQVKTIFDTNVIGVLNTIHPLMPAMQKRGQGQIAIISSMAGFVGMPTAPAYGASKGAVRLYGLALRGFLASAGVGVSVVCPGFIRTPMTDVNRFPMPCLLSAEKAAARIQRGLAKNRAVVAFPLPMRAMMWLLQLLPASMVQKLLCMMPAKG